MLGVGDMSKTLVDLIREKAAWEQQGRWVPANGGTEVPFLSRSGVRLLYCYQPRSGKHAYLNVDTDIVLTSEEANLILGKY